MTPTHSHGNVVRGGRFAFLGLLLLVAWLPLPWGSHRPWSEATLELGVCLLWILWSVSLLRGNVTITTRSVLRWTPVLVLWFLWIAWIGLQLAQLSTETVKVLSPSSHEAYSAAYALVQIPQPVQLPVTLGWDVTRDGFLLTTAYFGLFVLVLVAVNSRRRLRLLAWTIVLSGVAQALYGGAMVISGAEFGWLQKKREYLGSATGTFVNRNHLAGYLEICLAVGIGLLLSNMRITSQGQTWRQRVREMLELVYSEKLRVRIFLGVMVLGLILTRSRMGNTAFFTSLILCGMCYVVLRERRYLGRAVFLFASLIVIDAWIVGSRVGLDALIARFTGTSVQSEVRVPILMDLIPMMDAYRLTGSGLGTFFLVYPKFRAPEIGGFVDHAHNDYAQFLIEAGQIGAGLVGLLGLFTVIHALHVIWKRHDRLVCGIAFGGLMATTSLAIHSVADFNLQIPANAATLVVVMAMTIACSPHSRRKQRSAEPASPAQVPEKSEAGSPKKLLPIDSIAND